MSRQSILASPDNRLATDLVSAIRSADGSTIGFIGVSVLVERIGRRLSTIDFADQEECQIVDQNGVALFGNDFKANPGPVSTPARRLINNIRADKSGHSRGPGKLYSFAPVESTGWTTVVKQPRIVAYKPVHDLLRKNDRSGGVADCRDGDHRLAGREILPAAK